MDGNDSLRRPLIAGNWKMSKTSSQAVELVEGLAALVTGSAVDIVVCPPFTALVAVGGIIKNTDIRLGAQNMHWEEQGAYTGEIAPAMLTDLGCQYVIIGHSERRQYFAETDATVNLKVKAALKHNLLPIVCVGETLQQREQGLTEQLIATQVQEAIKALQPEQIANLTFAYEPIWAIGTGQTADGAEANRICGLIRSILGQVSLEGASKVRILYGGSVKPENFAGFATQPEVDGALVGGASLKAEQFAQIIKVATE